MTPGYFTNHTATFETLDRAVTFAAPHLRPVLEAVRDHGIGMLIVQQAGGAFRLPAGSKRPAVVSIGDDLARAVGPTGFHMPSVRRAIRACSAFVVVSSGPNAEAYAAASDVAALTRSNVMLVETRLEQELAWLELIQKLAPGEPILLSTVEGGHA